MSLGTGLFAHARRLPDRLDDLHGPWQGTVVLPVHLTWHQLRLLVSNRMRRACERKLGLPPAGTDTSLHMPG
jgi:hypothetical protein